MATGKVWAVLQQRDGELHRQSRETIAAAAARRQTCSSFGRVSVG